MSEYKNASLGAVIGGTVGYFLSKDGPKAGFDGLAYGSLIGMIVTCAIKQGYDLYSRKKNSDDQSNTDFTAKKDPKSNELERKLL